MPTKLLVLSGVIEITEGRTARVTGGNGDMCNNGFGQDYGMTERIL